MSFNWPHFLKISRLLSKYATNPKLHPDMKEAAYRCAVSRAYYSAFGYSFDYAEDMLSYPALHDGRDHYFLREWYKKKNFPEIKRKLLNLWKMRKECDYNAFINNVDVKAEGSIQLANEIIEKIDYLNQH